MQLFYKISLILFTISVEITGMCPNFIKFISNFQICNFYFSMFINVFSYLKDFQLLYFHLQYYVKILECF